MKIIFDSPYDLTTSNLSSFVQRHQVQMPRAIASEAEGAEKAESEKWREQE